MCEVIVQKVIDCCYRSKVKINKSRLSWQVVNNLLNHAVKKKRYVTFSSYAK